MMVNVQTHVGSKKCKMPNIGSTILLLSKTHKKMLTQRNSHRKLFKTRNTAMYWWSILEKTYLQLNCVSRGRPTSAMLFLMPQLKMLEKY